MHYYEINEEGEAICEDTGRPFDHEYGTCCFPE